jgi:hypothetical protein
MYFIFVTSLHFSVARHSYPVNAREISRMDTSKRKNCQKKSVTVNNDHPSVLIIFHAVKTGNIWVQNGCVMYERRGIV